MRKIPIPVVIISIIILTSIVVYSADAAGIPKKAISTVARFLESDLPTTTVFTDQANTYTAGQKQMFQSSSTTAGLNFAGVSSDPSGVTAGDVWRNTASDALKVRGTSITQTIPTLENTETFTGTTTLNSLTLGGDANAGSHKITSLATPTSATDAARANTLQTKALATGTCSNGQYLAYQTSNSTWICTTLSALTSLNGDSTAAQTVAGTTGNVTVTNAGATHTINTGTNVVVTGGSAQTVTKSMTFTNTVTIQGLLTSQGTKTSSSYNVLSTDTVIYADASSNSVTINLPTPSTVTGQVFIIKRIDSSITNSVTVSTSSGFIDSSGITTKSLDHRNQFVGVQSDGTNYRKIVDKSYSIFGYMPKGSTLNRYVSSPSTGTAFSTATLTTSALYAMPFVVEETSTFDTVAIKVTTSKPGSTSRIGIYSDSNTQPGSLVADFGTVATAATGVQTLTASPLPVTLSPGLYWLVISNSAGASVQGFAVTGLISLLGDDSAMGTAPGFGWVILTASSGYTCCATGFPSTFPTSGATVMTTIPLPQIALRLSN